MMTTKMAVFHGAGQPLELVRRDAEIILDSGQCLVEVLLATVCGSDLHTVDGRRGEPVPCVLGHEGVGRVVAVGRRPRLGARGLQSFLDYCGLLRSLPGVPRLGFAAKMRAPFQIRPRAAQQRRRLQRHLRLAYRVARGHDAFPWPTRSRMEFLEAALTLARSGRWPRVAIQPGLES